jgi:acetyl esterase/lipase
MLVSCSAAATPTPGQAPAGDGILLQEDLIYGRVEGSALLADLAQPPGDGPFPAILSVHGGRWVAGHRKDTSSIKPRDWAQLGFVAMTIDYRLAKATPAPACYQDMLCAIRYLRAHSARYRIDPSRIFVIGQSAGGQMASLLATLGEGPYKKAGGWTDQSAEIRAVISVCAPYELNTLDWGKLWVPLTGDATEARRLASPLHQISPRTRPILVIHSDDDKSVPIQQAIDMAQALEQAKIRSRFIHYKDRGHMGITPEVTREALAFIKEVSAAR